MKSYLLLLIVALLFTQLNSNAQSRNKVLFDCTKAETAGNADWQIDSDVFNLGVGTGGIMRTGSGNEANPQRIPTPSWTTITASTPETIWNGALSSWGVALAKLGYEPQTLPNGGRITFNDSSNPQDLSNYVVYIIVEPNILFTMAEKTAIINYVSSGGGLFIISDHNQSDRNTDGSDSPAVLNDLMSNNGVQANPFGFTFDLLSFSELANNAANLPSDSVLHQGASNVSGIQISSGTSLTLNPTANQNVKGLLYRASSSNSGNSNVLVASSIFGRGKVVALGDSSPPDDGTGDSGDNLYYSWAAEAGGNHARLFINASLWLSHPITTTSTKPNSITNLQILNVETGISVHSSESGEITIYDILGRIQETKSIQANVPSNFTLSSGYHVVCFKGSLTTSQKMIVK